MATSINISNTYSIANKYGLPQLDDNDFDHWKHELEMWQLVTDLDIKKQAPVIYLSLSGKARQACASLNKTQLNADDGVDVLLNKLSELYAKDKDQATYESYENFETFRRDKTMNIRDYINEFERLNDKLKSFNINLPDPVLAYQLLKNANLPSDKRDLARATISSLTFDAMKKQIKAIYDHCSTTNSDISSTDIKVEPDDVYYGRGYKPPGRFTRGRSNFRRGSKGYARGTVEQQQKDDGRNYYKGNNKPNNKSGRLNPLDESGNQSTCFNCGSIFHWANDCPNSYEKRSKDISVQLFTKEVTSEYLEVFVSETLNYALLDSGCNSTVCGENWLKCYLDTLEDSNIAQMPSANQFRFGDGKIFHSKGKVNIPATIGNQNVFILTDIVDCEIPLLLSKASMKAANTKLDFASDTVNMYGADVMLNLTSNGHYCIPISTKHVALNKGSEAENGNFANIHLTIHNLDEKSEKEKDAIAVKLHKQFGHPVDGNKLKQLLHDANINDKVLESSIDKITENCDKKYPFEPCFCTDWKKHL